MNKRIKVCNLPEFDATLYLEDEVSIAAYLTDIFEANDTVLLTSALGDIVRSLGVTEIAKLAGLTRGDLHKALCANGALSFETVNRVCAALGLRLVAQAMHDGFLDAK